MLWVPKKIWKCYLSGFPKIGQHLLCQEEGKKIELEGILGCINNISASPDNGNCKDCRRTLKKKKKTNFLVGDGVRKTVGEHECIKVKNSNAMMNSVNST